MQSAAHVRKIGPYSAPTALMRLDGRTREARFRKQYRAHLVSHVGGNPSAVQSALIDLATDTAFQIELMRLDRGENGALSDHSHRTMLAWANTLRRTLLQLGLRGVAEAPPSLADILRTAPQTTHGKLAGKPASASHRSSGADGAANVEGALAALGGRSKP